MLLLLLCHLCGGSDPSRPRIANRSRYGSTFASPPGLSPSSRPLQAPACSPRGATPCPQEPRPPSPPHPAKQQQGSRPILQGFRPWKKAEAGCCRLAAARVARSLLQRRSSDVAAVHRRLRHQLRAGKQAQDHSVHLGSRHHGVAGEALAAKGWLGSTPGTSLAAAPPACLCTGVAARTACHVA